MFRSSFFAILLLPALLNAQQRPPELGYIPSDAMAFASVRGDLWKSDALKPVRDYFTKQDPTALKKMASHVGFTPDDVARVTLLMPSSESLLSPPLIFVTLNKPY